MSVKSVHTMEPDVPKLTLLIVLAVLAVLAGCASRELIIDRKGVDPARYEADLADCRAYAAAVSRGDKVLTGTAGGAVVGGATGAAAGNSTTAKRGAGVGAVLGMFKGLGKGEQEHRTVLRRCMSGRGYRVLN